MILENNDNNIHLKRDTEKEIKVKEDNITFTDIIEIRTSLASQFENVISESGESDEVADEKSLENSFSVIPQDTAIIVRKGPLGIILCFFSANIYNLNYLPSIAFIHQLNRMCLFL